MTKDKDRQRNSIMRRRAWVTCEFPKIKRLSENLVDLPCWSLVNDKGHIIHDDSLKRKRSNSPYDFTPWRLGRGLCNIGSYRSVPLCTPKGAVELSGELG